jgi:DNA-binding transcriptional ArsR family regulator
MAVSDPTRLRFLNLLRLGGICMRELQSVLQIPQTKVSRPLAGLKNAGLVPDCRNGNKTFYPLATAGINQIAALYERLDRLCPGNGVMQGDLERSTKAVRTGICHPEPYNAVRKIPVSVVEKRL